MKTMYFLFIKEAVEGGPLIWVKDGVAEGRAKVMKESRADKEGHVTGLGKGTGVDPSLRICRVVS